MYGYCLTTFCLFQPEERVNFEFETLFETGVDEMSWDDTVRIKIYFITSRVSGRGHRIRAVLPVVYVSSALSQPNRLTHGLDFWYGGCLDLS